MNKKIIGLIFGMIIVISSVLVFSSLTENSKQVGDEENQGDLAIDILNEIDESLLGEDDEIEIGEMV
ncbi:MAG: hypothetical protein ACTSQ3_05645 [Candidatus Heimdallarchaeota archaeon]